MEIEIKNNKVMKRKFKQ